MKFQFFINNEVAFECKINSVRCIGKNKSGQICKRRICIGTPYCFTHLPSYMHLKVKISNIPNAGKGIFAIDKTKNDNEIVFKKGDIICKYGGEFINLDEKNERYENYTAPYGMELSKNVFQDCACKRDVGSIVNTANYKKDNNVEFIISTRPTREVKLRAKKNIYNNQELLVDYGRTYKLHENGASYRTK
jgi:hypothetical protein